MTAELNRIEDMLTGWGEEEVLSIEEFDRLLEDWRREWDAKEQAEADTYGMTVEELRELKSNAPSDADLAYEYYLCGVESAAVMDDDEGVDESE